MWQYNQSRPSELYHYGIKGMRWGHHVKKDVDANSGGDDYKPEKFEPSSIGNTSGYVDENGIFYRGNYNDALARKKSSDYAAYKAKIAASLKESRYNSSIQKKIDDAVNDISKTVKRVADIGEDVINRGRNALAGLMEKAAHKLRVRK